MMPFYGPIFATHGPIFATGNFIFLKMLINCEQLKFLENFGRKIQKNRSKKMSFLLSKFFALFKKSYFFKFSKTLILCGQNGNFHGHLFDNSRSPF